MADLKTNYVDDVLNTDVNTQRKYQMVTNDDGTVSFVDVTDYAQVGDSFGGADINKTNEAVNGLNNALCNQRVLLWTNENPTSAFNAQTIDVDTSGYNYLEIEFLGYADTGKFCSVLKVPKEYPSFIFSYALPSSEDTGAYVYSNSRKGSFTDTQITFEKCWCGYDGAYSNVNTRCVPYKIYGIK